MRARLRPVCLVVGILLSFSLYLLFYETGVRRGQAAGGGGLPDSPQLGSLQHLFGQEQQLAVPEPARTTGGRLNASDGCRRLWLSGHSDWFDMKFSAGLSPLWTGNNRELGPDVARWWKTLQGSRGTNNISSEIQAALDVIGMEDPYWVRNISSCLRCAVVGNSGNLRGSNYSQLIDSHDFVFRINRAPHKGYSDDVGSKETHRFMYPESFQSLGPEVHFVLMDFKLLDIAWLTSALTNGSIEKTYTKVKRTIDVSRDKVMIYNPALMHHVHSEWLEKHGRYPSTGQLALFFALQICDEVDVFGYGANKLGNWDHYWSKDDGTHNSFFKTTGVHDSTFEQSVMEKLQKAGKIRIYPGVR